MSVTVTTCTQCTEPIHVTSQFFCATHKKERCIWNEGCERYRMSHQSSRQLVQKPSVRDHRRRSSVNEWTKRLQYCEVHAISPSLGCVRCGELELDLHEGLCDECNNPASGVLGDHLSPLLKGFSSRRTSMSLSSLALGRSASDLPLAESTPTSLTLSTPSATSSLESLGSPTLFRRIRNFVFPVIVPRDSAPSRLESESVVMSIALPVPTPHSAPPSLVGTPTVAAEPF